MNQTQMAGRKLGKEVLEEFMIVFSGIAAAHQPASAAEIVAWANSPREAMFEKYAKLAVKAAHDLADFQSPKLAAVHIAAPAPLPTGPVRKKFTINIFDHLGRPALRHIDVKPTSANAALPKLPKDQV